VGLNQPDGRVDPNGPTLSALNTFDEPEIVELLPPGKAWLV
jgi:hypothetical protein